MSRDAKIVAALVVASVLGTGALVQRFVEKVRSQGGLGAMLAPLGAEPFQYATVRRAQAEPPARFAAPLPRVEEFADFEAERFPPRAHVRDLLCAGDDGMWRRLQEALSASRDASEAGVAKSYGELLRSCSGDGCFAARRDPERRQDLARALSRVGDPRARAALRAACDRRPDPAQGAEAPEPPGAPPPAALVGRLRALGLLPDGELAAAEVAGIASADQLLVAARRAHAFDVETGEFPNGHDALLRDLAALAPGALAGALFDEVPPPEDDEQRPYVVRAWAFGERWEVDAQNLCDWFDVGACVGLLNALARERKLDVRWLVLETGDQIAIVAAGPEAGLRTALAEGLLRRAPASDAADAGKAFEQKVLEQLRGAKP